MDTLDLARAIFAELTKQAAPVNVVYVANPVDLDDLTLVTIEGTFDLAAVAAAIVPCLAGNKPDQAQDGDNRTDGQVFYDAMTHSPLWLFKAEKDAAPWSSMDMAVRGLWEIGAEALKARWGTKLSVLEARAERAEALIKLVNDDVRCHLRNGSVQAALLRKHAVAAVREYVTERAASLKSKESPNG